MAKPKSIMLYLDTESVLEPLSLEEVGTVFLSIFEYVRKREVTRELSVGAQVAFRSIKNFIDRDIENYEAKCKLNSEKGKKGGRPRKTLPQTEEKSCGFFEKAEKAYNNNNNNNNSNNNNNILEEEQFFESPPLPEKSSSEPIGFLLFKSPSASFPSRRKRRGKSPRCCQSRSQMPHRSVSSRLGSTSRRALPDSERYIPGVSPPYIP